MEVDVLMRNANVTTYLCKIDNTERQFMWHKGKRYSYAHVVWNFLNPCDTVLQGEIIHHLDGDTMNDDPDNLIKMTNSEHSRMHAINVSDDARARMSLGVKDAKQRLSHCKRGHKMSGSNLMVSKRTSKRGTEREMRQCRECANMRSRKYSEKARMEERNGTMSEV